MSACTECGYDLQGLNPGTECPECGTDQQEPTEQIQTPAWMRAIARLSLTTLALQFACFIAYLSLIPNDLPSGRTVWSLASYDAMFRPWIINTGIVLAVGLVIHIKSTRNRALVGLCYAAAIAAVAISTLAWIDATQAR